MAEISLRHGIILDPSSRAERGITERPITYAQYRRLERQQARQIRFRDADLEQLSLEEDHSELSQPFHLEATAGGSEGAQRHNNRQNGSKGHLQELAGFGSENGGHVGMPWETERPAQPSVSQTDSIGSGSSRLSDYSGRNPNGNSVIPRSATADATCTTYDQQRRSKRPRGNDGGPSGAKHARLDAIEVESEANANGRDDCSDSFAQAAKMSRFSSLQDMKRASTATDPLSATATVQKRTSAPSKRLHEDNDEEAERKRARNDRSYDGHGGNSR